ncbi:cysteine and histidine-rich domain-containing protein 1 [Synchiropus splendidus]|uniref:cysteine and histidine-rich domain-containing protein 1 n=1 Tax=Synchiropus splendidus TaxID=270530 RepID=UPI00237DCBF8|nr:cysteine and histidine-rich domain-containing protein 1 [Synchiropus splendidus]
MTLVCYNKGCGEKFSDDQNREDSCVFHPGFPIFHDALKGWSCCKKRTTDFSEFLSIKGCTRGRHSNEKPKEPMLPEVTSQKGDIKPTNGHEIIYQGPKSAEKLQKERPSRDVPKTKLPHKVSASLAQALAKLDLNIKAQIQAKESQTVIQGTRCKNSGCKTTYQGPETDLEVCTHHPGGPVFHEGYKYWSCCCIKTIDFNAFLDQKGCTAGKHRWIPKQDKKKVACRHDWHQTGNNVYVTIYAKNASPEFSSIEANGTVLSCQIQFENDKIFKKEYHLWGVIDVQQSSVNMVPTKVEVCLRKADLVSWGKLEDPNYKAELEPVEDTQADSVGRQQNPDWDIADDDISDSDEEWAYDTPENKAQLKSRKQKKEEEEKEENKRRKEVEEEMKRAMEAKRRAEEEREALKRQEEEEGFEDMPDLE